MDGQQQQKKREKEVGEEKSKQEGKEGQSTKIQSHTTNSSPPSASSSPSHEFSFTVSLHSSSMVPDKTKSPSSFAVDLSPADDIFFHGHLLPLHFLSQLPISRSSINSLDSFSLPLRDSLEDPEPNNSTNSSSSNNNNSHHSTNSGTKGRSKAKSFSLFGLAKRQKGCEVREQENEEEAKKRKGRFDVGHNLKRYLRMVRPLLFFRGRENRRQLSRQPHSFSGNLNLKGKQEWGGRREFSAPASLRTSPTNSGLLLATATLPSTSDSTMEELQSAIQAAIAHCKNSISMEEKLIC